MARGRVATRAAMPLCRAEPGCLQDDVDRDLGDPSTFFLFERYADQEELEAYGASSDFKALALDQAHRLLASRSGTC